jgi:hypothetical protein
VAAATLPRRQRGLHRAQRGRRLALWREVAAEHHALGIAGVARAMTGDGEAAGAVAGDGGGREIADVAGRGVDRPAGRRSAGVDTGSCAGRRSDASPRHDLVVLRVDAKQLPTLVLGDTSLARPGDPVVAIGHPLGLEDTVSNGLLSAVRKLDGMVVLQVTAPIAPGSSGGPIFNEQGQVIGVATAILSGGQNINLGLPANYVSALMEKPEPMSFERFVKTMAVLRESLRPPERKLAVLPLSVFAGCSNEALQIVGHGFGEAIAVGAPLYNQGRHRACYQIYEGAASDIENRLPKSCAGPKKRLAQGRAQAAKLSEPSDQAWAMRDAFDSLVDALRRKHEAE